MISSLNVLNKVNEPTNAVRNMKKVIDLTLGTNKIGNLVSNWHVPEETSLSDHKHIPSFLLTYTYFQTGNIAITRVTFRNSKRTNWESYKHNLRANLVAILRSIRMIRNRSGC
jgi:hypothetical protein